MTPYLRYFASRLILKPLIAVLMVLAAVPAMALQTAWDVTEGGRMRLSIDPIPDDDGLIRGALEIDLEEGWKTYWIDPGAAGIPPQIDLTGSQGISLKSMRLPAPVRVDDGYSIWAGYKQSVTYALTFERYGAAMLRAKVFVGICDQICVPFQAQFSLDIPAPENVFQTDVSAQAVIAQSKAKLPGLPRPDFRIEAVSQDADGKSLLVTALTPKAKQAGDEVNVFIAREGWFFGPPETIAANEDKTTFRILVVHKPKDENAQDRPLYVVMTLGEQAVEAQIPVQKTRK